MISHLPSHRILPHVGYFFPLISSYLTQPWSSFRQPYSLPAVGQYMPANAEMTASKNLSTGTITSKPYIGGPCMDGFIKDLTKGGVLPTLDFLSVAVGYTMARVRALIVTTYYSLPSTHCELPTYCCVLCAACCATAVGCSPVACCLRPPTTYCVPLTTCG